MHSQFHSKDSKPKYSRWKWQKREKVCFKKLVPSNCTGWPPWGILRWGRWPSQLGSTARGSQLLNRGQGRQTCWRKPPFLKCWSWSIFRGKLGCLEILKLQPETGSKMPNVAADSGSRQLYLSRWKRLEGSRDSFTVMNQYSNTLCWPEASWYQNISNEYII